MDFLKYLFGCKHDNISFPRTIRTVKDRPEAARLTGTYIVCLDCGKEFPYNLEEMKIIKESKNASRRNTRFALFD